MPKRLLVVLMVVLGLAAVGSAIGYWMVFSSNTASYAGTRSVKLPRGSTLAAAIDSLVAARVLKSPTTFRWVANATGWGEQIKPGHYALASGSSNYDLLDKLRRGLQDPVRITIPPGSYPEVIAAAVAREMAFTKEDFRAALADSSLAASLETDTKHLFAYMMPETYFVYWLTSAEEVVRKVKREADQYIDGLTQTSFQRLNLSRDELLRMASLVEWESNHVPEKPRIAGVYLNRLRDGWPLQADPTVQYALIELEGKKRRLFNRDYKLKHPYNTYLYRGLPPGPVTNPTPTSIKGTYEAENHGYYFFVSRGDGTHIFSKTLGEHRRNAQAYYRVMRERRQAEALAK